MCQTTIAGVDDMDEITSTCHKKTGRLIEPRKIRKPLMEKKRRARINRSLDELKRFIVDAEKLAGQDLSRVNKLEKADILEMTVKYLKRNKAPPPAAPDGYLAGYRQCMEQVQDLLAEQWTDERRQQSGRRMVEHLEVCARRLNAPHNRLPASFFDEFNHNNNNNNAVTTNITGGNHLATTVVASVRRSSCCTATCSDDDSVGDELLNAAATARPSPDRTTEFRDTAPKSAWRPW